MSTIRHPQKGKEGSNWVKKVFGLDFEEEGSGSTSEEKTPVSVFSGILGRKFWALLRLNLLQTVTSLPAFLLTSLILSGILFLGEDQTADRIIALRVFLGFLLVDLQVVTVGPFQAGFVYVLKLFSQETNAFLLHDFLKGAKENLKQGLAVGSIDLLATVLIFTGFRFYRMQAERFGWPALVCAALICVFALLFVLMHFYIYPMMVMLKVTLRQLYGNALRFAAGFIFENLLILMLQALFVFLIFYNTAVGLILAALCGYSFTGLLTTFLACRKIDECIVSRLEPENSVSDNQTEDLIAIIKEKKGGKT